MMESAITIRYRLAIIVVGLAVIGGLHIAYPVQIVDWQGMVFFLILMVMSEMAYIPLQRGSLNVTFAILLPAYLFYGAVTAATMYVVGNLIGHIIARPRTLTIMGFNASQLGLSTLAGATGYWLATGEQALTGGPGLSASPYGLAVFIVVFLIINHVLVQIGMNLQREGKLQFGKMIRSSVEPMKWDMLVRALTVPLGLLLSWLYINEGVMGAVLTIIPLLCVAYIFRLHLSLSMANRELTILYEVAQRVGSVLQLEKLFDLIAEAIERVVRYDVCSLYLWDELKQELSLMMTKHPTPEIFEGTAIKLGQGIIGSVALNREPDIIYDAMKDPRVIYHPDDRFPPRSMLVVPLIVEDELVGTVAIGHNHPGAFTTDHLRLLTILASQAAVAVENAILYRRTEQMAITDPMTDLFNYRYFYVKLGDELKKAKAAGASLSLIYIDLDNFKRYNDTYGHTTGDRILREFANIIRQNIRDSDTPVRYAGDEFVVLLSNTDIEEAKRVANRIGESVKEHAFMPEDEEGLQLTISMGIANYPLNADTESELIIRADEAMYRGKQCGSNRICMPDCSEEEGQA